MISSDNTSWERALPAVTWLRSYRRSWFRLDLVAGITLAAYLLPAALGDASLASTQLPKLFGFHGAHGSFWENAGFFFKHLSGTNSMSLLVGGTALALLILGKIFLKHKPVALFVVIGGIVAASVLSLETHGV